MVGSTKVSKVANKRLEIASPFSVMFTSAFTLGQASASFYSFLHLFPARLRSFMRYIHQ